MSTGAAIEFRDSHDTFWLFRSHDGFPDEVLPDLKEGVKRCGESRRLPAGLVATTMLGTSWSNRLPFHHYELCDGPHVDPEYAYVVEWVWDRDAGRPSWDRDAGRPLYRKTGKWRVWMRCTVQGAGDL
jgi:hypothetical protein